MLCSARELELGDDHNGIIELPADAEVGAPAAEALGLDDPVIEIKVTPNRADCLGVHGIARDLAAAGLGRLKPRDFDAGRRRAGRPARRSRLDFPTAEEQACPLFVGRHHPRRAERPEPGLAAEPAEGDRPAADLGPGRHHQLLTFDLCRPLHVFDAGKLAGDLVVRLARAGRAAAGARRQDLPARPRHDRDRRRRPAPVSLGGIMGGEATGVHRGHDRRVPRGGAVRPDRAPPPPAAGSASRATPATASSAASTRRWSCPGAEIATRLILELCGGEPGRPSSPAAVPAPAPRRSASAAARCSALGGHRRSSRRRSSAILPRPRLPARAAARTSGRCTPPSWRHDVIDRGLHRRGAGAAARLRPHPGRARCRARRRSSAGLLTPAPAAPWRCRPARGGRSWATPRRSPGRSSRPSRPRCSAAREPVAEAQPAQCRAVGDAALAAAQPGRRRPRATSPASRSRARCSSSARASPAASRASRRWRWPACATASAAPAALGRARPAGRRARRQGATRSRRWRPLGVKPEQRPGRGRGARPGTTRAARAPARRADLCSPPSASCTRDVLAAVRPRGAGGRPSSSTSTRCRCPRRAPSKARPALEPLPFPPVDRDFAFLVDATVPAARLLDAVRGRRPQAGPRGPAVRRLRGQGRAGGQEVAGGRGAAPGPRPDADRGRDRAGGGQDRGGGGEGDGGGAAGVTRRGPPVSLRYGGHGNQIMRKFTVEEARARFGDLVDQIKLGAPFGEEDDGSFVIVQDGEPVGLVLRAREPAPGVGAAGRLDAGGYRGRGSGRSRPGLREFDTRRPARVLRARSTEAGEAAAKEERACRGAAE